MVTKEKSKKTKLIYVYMLVDETKFKKQKVKNQFKASIYVGKGTGSRMHEHTQQVLRALEDEDKLCALSNRKKIEALRQNILQGRAVKAVRISAGYSSDKDAFRAERLAIDMINSFLISQGDAPLLNASKGHGAGACDIGEHFIFAACEEYLLPKKSDTQAILVKTATHDSGDGYFKAKKEPFSFKGNEIPSVALMGRELRDRKKRRPWDPLAPWSDDEARARCCRYWPIAKEKVVDWLTNKPADRPTVLLGCVPDGNETVVRYAWKIDYTARKASDPNRWQYYDWGKNSRWGIPIGKRILDHPLLGKKLMEKRNGKKVQVLLNFPKGVRVINIPGNMPAS